MQISVQTQSPLKRGVAFSTLLLATPISLTSGTCGLVLFRASEHLFPARDAINKGSDLLAVRCHPDF